MEAMLCLSGSHFSESPNAISDDLVGGYYPLAFRIPGDVVFVLLNGLSVEC